MKLLTVLGVIGVLLLFVWERVDVVRVGYHIEQLKVRKTVLQREQDELRMRASALTAPERIARVATEKLGMVPPQPGQVILVHENEAGPRSVAPEVRMAKSEGMGKRP